MSACEVIPLQPSSPVEAFLQWGTDSGHSPATRKLYGKVLGWFVRDHPDPLAVTGPEIRVWLQQFEGLARNTRRAYGKVIRSFYHTWATDEAELLDSNPCRRVPMPRQRQGSPRPISPGRRPRRARRPHLNRTCRVRRRPVGD